MLEKVKKFIDQNSLIEENSSILVAVSGGPDSRALLDLLYRLRERYGLRLVVAHLNHGLRGRESRLDQLFTEKLAQDYDLEIITNFLEKGKINSEEEARQARLAFLLKIAREQEISQIALGQTLSDQSETIIHNFIRGSGLKGLTGMVASRKLVKEKREYYLIRPLLSVGREELIRYLTDHNLRYRLDSTNPTLKYTRNKLRHQIIPLLKKLNPNLEESLAQKSLIFQSINSYLTAQAQAFLDKASWEKGRIIFSQVSYLDQAPALKYQILREGIERLKGNLDNIQTTHLLEIDQIFNQRSREKKEKQVQNLNFRKRAGKIYITIDQKLQK
jgi:tRNA(Ile)-lysidine synthase